MIYLLVSFGLFVLSVAIHVIVHRILVRFGIVTFHTIVVFAVGFFIAGFVLFRLPSTDVMALPFTSLFLYALLSMVHIIYFVNPFFGDRSPSVTILLIVRERGSCTFTDLQALFSDEQLIANRLNGLIGTKYIEKKGDVYRVLPRGRRLATQIALYRAFLGWKSSG